MATIKVCDGGCGKRSPDDDGMHIANGWFRVTVLDGRKKSRYTDRTQQYLLCRDCAAPILETVGAPTP